VFLVEAKLLEKIRLPCWEGERTKSHASRERLSKEGSTGYLFPLGGYLQNCGGGGGGDGNGTS